MTDFSDKEYRHAYARASVEQGIAWQIRLNREHRGWSVEELAQRSGVDVEYIKIFENTEVDAQDLDVDFLIKIACAFDVVLRMDFVDFPTLAEASEHLSEEDQVIEPYQGTT